MSEFTSIISYSVFISTGVYLLSSSILSMDAQSTIGTVVLWSFKLFAGLSMVVSPFVFDWVGGIIK